MSKIPSTLRYTPEHQWASPTSEGLISVGITDYAQSSLGDVVFIDLPSPGTKVQKDKPMFTIESVKAASDVYAPISGSIREINPELKETPESVNTDPYASWMVHIAPDNPDDFETLMNAERYAEIVSPDH